jgi:hypothetical protein
MIHMPDFLNTGAIHFPDVLDHNQTIVLGAQLEPVLADGRPGKRLTGGLDDLLGQGGALGLIAVRLLGGAALPVRALLFDKTPDTNWSVGWHQDRTVAVRERRETAGYGPWSVKDGIPHVAPPISVLEGMITLRLHLDDCDENNAPLKVALGSHRLGLVPADQAANEANSREVIACHARTGDVWAYSTLILHASERSRSIGRRRVLQVDYAAAKLSGGLEWRGL